MPARDALAAIAAALKDASGTALLALGLVVADPGAAHRSEHGQPAGPAAALGLRRRRRGARLRRRGSLYLLGCGFAAPARRRAVAAPDAQPRSRSSAPLAIAGVVAAGRSIRCSSWPLAGRAGAIKWIDNFGIQILIYVMLGWGLNIVVGLAGLLDLGYVAFYAVGAYAFALLAQHFDLGFWVCLPLAGILAAFWGVLLGFPVLRLRGDYLAIVTLAFGEIIRLVPSTG